MKIMIIINQQRITLNYLKMKKNNINYIYLVQLFMIVLLIILGTSKLNAQLKVGNNPKTLNQNSLFEMESTNKGMLMPRLALVHPDSFTPMTAHIKGMIVFNTDSTSNVKPGLYYNSGTKWLKIPSAMVVNNGLSLSNDSLALGGTIIKPTTIAGLTDTNKMQFIGQGNNMFSIDDSIFSVDGTKNNIGIGTKTPINSAILELNSTNKGFLIPRVQLTSLTSPLPLDAFTPGMVVYCIGNAGTAPNNVTAGFYVANTFSWSRTTMSFGDRGDITITGDMQTPTFTIDNGVVSSEKLATSLKVGGGAPTNPSVALEVTGGNKGFVVSTTSSLASIANPIVGMMVYSTSENCLRIYTATGWSNCLLAATGDASTGGSGVASAYGAGGNRSTTPVYGKCVTGLTTTISATVGTTGSYNIIVSSATLPGLIFTATGTFAGTGAQTVTLTATGAIATAYAGATHTFTSNTTPSFTFTLTVAAMTYVTGAGSTFNAFYNGQVDGVYTGTITTVTHNTGENFSSTANCATKTISQTSPANCPTSVTGTSGTVYPLVWINGQCWMQTNLKEVPTNFPDAPNTGNNIWLNTTIADVGKWGYYNTTTVNGTAGWETIEPINPITSGGGEGILYQWSAAMNNATAERAQGACPTGFHIPSDCEWNYLEHGMGMSISEQTLFNTWRSNTFDNQGTPGYKLRSQGTGQTNASGFSGLFTGFRNTNGTFISRASYGSLWSSSATDATSAIFRNLVNNLRGVARFSGNKAHGVSVRCLKN
jgi:uncharacterized protein (TIGR02145 family)